MNLFVSKFSIAVLRVIKQFLTGYIVQYDSPQLLFNHIMDVIVIPLLAVIIINILKLIFNNLNSKIKLYNDGAYNDFDKE